MHRNAFAEHWNKLIKRDSIEFIVEHRIDRTGIIRFERRSQANISDLSLELGEFFYQLRASLDSLAFAGVRHLGGDPVPNESQIYFPVDAAPREYQRHAGYIGKLPKQLLSWIRSVQPCFSHESTDEELLLISRLLDLLHDCARKDRHRRLTVIGAWGADLSGTFSFTPTVRLVRIEGRSCNILDAGGVIADFLLSEHVPALKVDLQGSLLVDIVMENIAFRGPEFEQALDSMGRAVDYVIDRFDEAFLAL